MLKSSSFGSNESQLIISIFINILWFFSLFFFSCPQWNIIVPVEEITFPLQKDTVSTAGFKLSICCTSTQHCSFSQLQGVCWQSMQFICPRLIIAALTGRHALDVLHWLVRWKNMYFSSMSVTHSTLQQRCQGTPCIHTWGSKKR